MSLLLAPHYVPGVANGTVALSDDSVTGSKYAQWTIGFDGGTWLRNTAGAAHAGPDWIAPRVGMNLYEVRATDNASDVVPPGTLDTWLPLSESWTWGWTNNTGAEKSGSLLIEIRRAVDHVVVDSAIIDLLSAGLL